MKADVEGIFHIGDDGILRSLHKDNSVIEAHALSNAQLRAWIAKLPPSKLDIAHLYDVFDNVDEYDVTNTTQSYDPPAWLRVPSSADREAKFAQLKANGTAHSSTSPPQSRNELYDITHELEARQIACSNLLCASQFDCLLWGHCNACLHLDK